MEPRYNIYFDGQLLEGQDLGSVRDKLARLFKADQATLDKLFSGKPQLIKKECDKATALKFKQAIEQAGALPLIKAIAAAAEQAQPAQAPAMTAAQRIAALADAPDQGNYPSAEPEPVQNPVRDASDASDASELQLEPAGTDVLRPEERPSPVVREVDTSALALDSSAGPLAVNTEAPPPAPDTAHLSMGEVGETLPNLPSTAPVLEPDTDALDLSPAGTDFSDCVLPEVEAPGLDLSGIELAPAGASVLDESERKRAAVKAPTTDHLSLEE